MALPCFHLTGVLNDVLAGAVEIPTIPWRSARVVLTHNVNSVLTWQGQTYNRPPSVTVIADDAGDIAPNGNDVPLLANDPALALGVRWTASIYDRAGEFVASATFDAPLDGATLTLSSAMGGGIDGGVPAGSGPLVIDGGTP